MHVHTQACTCTFPPKVEIESLSLMFFFSPTLSVSPSLSIQLFHNLPSDNENVKSLFKRLLIKKTEMFMEIKLQGEKNQYMVVKCSLHLRAITIFYF